jgi:hypothetical protein
MEGTRTMVEIMVLKRYLESKGYETLDAFVDSGGCIHLLLDTTPIFSIRMTIRKYFPMRVYYYDQKHHEDVKDFRIEKMTNETQANKEISGI